MKKWMKNIVAVSLSSCLGAPLAGAQSLMSRPPQFVLLGFDGSLNLGFWKESRDFAKQMKAEGKSAPFTYFISGVYFLALENKNQYDAPHHGVGKSAIGFGGESANIPLRVDQLNGAFSEGHEIASHANGHFDAGAEGWSLENWKSEFAQFNEFIFNVFGVNRVRPTGAFNPAIKFSQSDVVGFRAPQLGVTKSMRTALKEFRFGYDTSLVQEPSYWPEKDALGIWNMPLARIDVVGTGKKAPAMDYNFYYLQSNANDVIAKKDFFKKQMLDSYFKYFQDNYNGNRAPIQIGHHFSKWNGGAYWEAMKEFTSAVCGQAEVKCVTFKEYMNWLNAQSKEQLAAYRSGRFEKRKELRLTENTRTRPVQVGLKISSGDRISVRAITPDVANLKGLYSQVSVNGQVIGQTEASLATIRRHFDLGDEALIMAQIFSRDGIEVARATQKLRDLGLSTERLDNEVLETRAQMGDMAEAHLSETE